MTSPSAPLQDGFAPGITRWQRWSPIVVWIGALIAAVLIVVACVTSTWCGCRSRWRRGDRVVRGAARHPAQRGVRHPRDAVDRRGRRHPRDGHRCARAGAAVVGFRMSFVALELFFIGLLLLATLASRSFRWSCSTGSSRASANIVIELDEHPGRARSAFG